MGRMKDLYIEMWELGQRGMSPNEIRKYESDKLQCNVPKSWVIYAVRDKYKYMSNDLQDKVL